MRNPELLFHCDSYSEMSSDESEYAESKTTSKSTADISSSASDSQEEIDIEMPQVFADYDSDILTLYKNTEELFPGSTLQYTCSSYIILMVCCFL